MIADFFALARARSAIIHDSFMTLAFRRASFDVIA